MSDNSEMYEHSREDPGSTPRRRAGKLVTAVIAVVALSGFAGIVAYAYNKGRDAGRMSAPPVIQAGPAPHKVKPETPGGMDVPHRKVEVYDRIGGGKKPEKTENLAKPPEKPMTPPKMAEKSTEMAAIAPAAGSPDNVGQPKLPPPPPVASAIPKPPPGSTEIGKQELPPPPPPSAAAPKQVAPPSAAPPPPPPPAVKKAPPAPTKTAAVRPPAKTPAKTRSKPVSGWKIQVASLRSEAEVRRAWNRLQTRNRDLLNNLDLNIARKDLGAKGVYYRLQAGPLADRSAASSLCSKLKQRKVGCFVVRP